MTEFKVALYIQSKKTLIVTLSSANPLEPHTPLTYVVACAVVTAVLYPHSRYAHVGDLTPELVFMAADVVDRK